MKALKILEALANNSGITENETHDPGVYFYDGFITLREAIEELEALLKPKHCMPDCMHYTTPTFDIDCPCRDCSRYAPNKSKDLYTTEVC